MKRSILNTEYSVNFKSMILSMNTIKIVSTAHSMIEHVLFPLQLIYP